jgi:hypothetical protein
MNEADQIFQLLSNATFWEEDQCRNWSMQMGGGMSVDIGTKGANWTWALTRPDRSCSFSPQAFPSVREAKNDLQAELKRRREALLYESQGPATIS